ncbi:tyrosine-type recombinase/integrase [Acidobacteria bacterium AH-259-G07]|nr:tyrosine-type recombinase/integrase [Acidobacteria bacterium AH-259-G07]
MPNDPSSAPFQSALAPFLDKFLQEKHACGYRYREPSRILRRFDDFVFQAGLTTCELPRSIAQKWLAKRAHESSRTHQQRIMVVRQFSRFLCRLGYSAYVPDSTLSAREQSSFAPRILTHEEIRKLLQAVDALEPTARSPLRHLIMPEVFRLLYGCGFRLGEVLKLRGRDVDLNQGIVTVRQGKFCKDRLVPPALSLVNRLRKYAAHFQNRPPDAIFFPAPDGGPFSLRTVYGLFRQLLLQCGIPHAGRGKGPRIHDLRHGFAVHTLLRWYRNGEDLDAKLPLLATYLGHQNLSGTQRYLHLTAELFPEITARVDAVFGEVIPGRIK